MTSAWDLIVIGSGSAGIVASRTAAHFGARVLLVENDRLGGDCLWTGCVPSKSLLAAGNVAQLARSTERFGITTSNVTVDFARTMSHVKGAVNAIVPHDSAETLKGHGVDVVKGTAAFRGRNTLTVDGETYSFRQAIIATGTKPTLPNLAGGDRVDILTSDTIWGLKELPKRLVILGAGPTGIELGQAMARLGSSVTIIDRGQRILPRENERASAILHAVLERDGITIHQSRIAEEVVSSDGVTGELLLDDHTRIPFDRLLAATGKTPNTRGLSPELAGVQTTDHGHISVDSSLRTTNKRIWAAGDVAGLPEYSHIAGMSGSTAATNATLGLRRKFSTRIVPRVTYSSPEIAAVGMSPADAVDGKHRVYIADNSSTDRAITELQTDGFAQLVVDKKGRVLGGTLVGSRAGESLGELTVAVAAGLTTTTLAGATHAYPTFSDSLWDTAIADLQYRLKHGAAGFVLRMLTQLRRATL